MRNRSRPDGAGTVRRAYKAAQPGVAFVAAIGFFSVALQVLPVSTLTMVLIWVLSGLVFASVLTWPRPSR